jgi:histidine kinase
MSQVWRTLRWRLIAAQMLVVLVGVVVLALAVHYLIIARLPQEIYTLLAPLTYEGNQSQVTQVGQAVVETVRADVILALLTAAVAAAVAGLAAIGLIIQGILRPLRAITQSSARIAQGHYDERVQIPATQELADLATHYNQMAVALAEVEAQRVILLGNVSHELRTPLAGLRGYVEGLQDGLFQNDQATFVLMEQEIRRMQRLVDDIQALSRVESGQISLEMQPVDLLPLVQRAVVQIRPQADTECLMIDLTHSRPRLTVWADADRVAQIVLNLLSNAVRYTPKGGCITVSAEQRMHGGRPHAAVVVQDDGIGIPAEALPHLFERFYRVDPSRTRASGGSGIGLTISRHLAWAMQGEILAYSEGEDRGSVFTLLLPIYSSESEKRR